MQLWNDNDSNEYWSRGYTCIQNVVPESILLQIEQLIESLIMLEANRAGLASQFENRSREWRLHQGLIRLPDGNRRIVVDKINQSDFCRRIFSQENFLSLARNFTKSEHLSELAMSNFFVRVDLPGQNEEAKQRFSLPWHQDGGYYANKSCPRTSAVIWFPVFDCFQQDGCLEVCAESHTQGLVKHDEFYIVPEERKHWRVEVPDEVVNSYDHLFAECPRNAACIFHMSLIHRSGYNATENVRYSFIIRASNLLSESYVI